MDTTFRQQDTETLQHYYAEIGSELLRRGVLEETDLRYSEHNYQRQPVLDGFRETTTFATPERAQECTFIGPITG